MKFRDTPIKLIRINIGTMKATKQIFFTFEALAFGAAIFLLLSLAHCTAAQEVRTWVDSSGQHKIEATYEKLEGDNVFLKMPDGSVKQIPFTMLSSGDQDHIRKLNAPTEPAEPLGNPETSQPLTSKPIAPGSTVPVDEAMPAASAGGQEVRTWVDSSGQHKIKATYQKYENDNVFLKLPDGQVKQIPFSMLSDEDKERVRKLNAPEKPMDKPADLPTTSVAAETSSAELNSPPPTMPANKGQEIDLLTEEDLAPPEPIIHISQRIGDLDIRKIEPPKTNGGKRANPKYLLAVGRSDLALLPKEFQGAAVLLLDEPNNPRKAVPALDYLKVKWPSNRQPVLIKLVINCASSDHKFNREAALEILSNRDSDQSFPYIFARVDDTSFTIRSQAYQILRRLGDRRAIEPLAKRFASDDVDRISSLLRSFGSDCEVAVQPYLSHEDPDIRLRACNLIGKIGTEKSLPALQEMAAREQTMTLKAQTRAAINKIKRRTGNSPQ